jgi:hypothetical protein
VSTFAKSRAAAGYAARHSGTELTAARAAVLLRRLRACEAALSGGDGPVPAITAGLLRAAVLAARDLAGRPWLEASGDDPDVAAFTALQTAPSPPEPAELDEIIARLLWARFAPSGTAPGVIADTTET